MQGSRQSEHAAKLVAEARRSFDRFRPEEPPLDERVQALLRAALPQGEMSERETLLAVEV